MDSSTQFDENFLYQLPNNDLFRSSFSLTQDISISPANQNTNNVYPYNLITPDYTINSDTEFFNTMTIPSAEGQNPIEQNSLQTTLQTPSHCTSGTGEISYDELEEFLTPLVSPAIPPNYSEVFQFFNSPNNDHYFTPLSSPSLLPEGDSMIPTMQKQFRDQINKISPGPSYRKSPLGLYSGRNPPSPAPLPAINTKKRPSLLQQIAIASPKLPATPASLMKLNHQATIPSTTTADDAIHLLNTPPGSKKRKLMPSPLSPKRTLRPLVSPFLQPEIMNTTTTTTTISPDIENRRSAHKVAEQRRRDILKQSFDSLRIEILDLLIQDSNDETSRQEKEKEVKLMSKVVLVQHAYEYIVRLKKDAHTKDEKMKQMQEEINKLKKTL